MVNFSFKCLCWQNYRLANLSPTLQFNGSLNKNISQGTVEVHFSRHISV